jgi:hypothetical protein
MRAPRLFATAAVALVALSAAPGRPGEPKQPGGQKDPPQKLPTASEIMLAKLKHAQTLIDALTREDFGQVEKNATALVRISDGAEFLNARRTEEYVVQARGFRETVSRMAVKARDRNIDGVMLAYLDMSTSCLKCHQYTRNRKKD